MIVKFFILSTLAIFLSWNTQVTAITVSCKYQDTLWHYMRGQTYTCRVQNSEDFKGSQLKIDGASGQHKDGKTNADVKGISIENAEQLEAFPSNLEKVFGSLTHICVYKTSLSSISSSDIAPFKDLKDFWMPLNKIKSIPGDLFAQNPNLEVANFYSNQVANIDPKAFSKLEKLRLLALAKNACKSMTNAMNRHKVEELVKRIEKSECSSKYDFQDIVEKKEIEESFLFDVLFNNEDDKVNFYKEY